MRRYAMPLVSGLPHRRRYRRRTGGHRSRDATARLASFWSSPRLLAGAAVVPTSRPCVDLGLVRRRDSGSGVPWVRLGLRVRVLAEFTAARQLRTDRLVVAFNVLGCDRARARWRRTSSERSSQIRPTRLASTPSSRRPACRRDPQLRDRGAAISRLLRADRDAQSPSVLGVHAESTASASPSRSPARRST